MLEYFGDYIGFIFLIIIVFLCGYYLLVIINSHHEATMRERAERYMSFYENADDDFDETSSTEEDS